MITTAGFRDVLEIGRQTRPKLYDLRVQKELPLVPRSRRVEVFERLNERGEVLIPFDEVSLRTAIERMQAAKVEAVAICLLFSFANPDADLALEGFSSEQVTIERALDLRYAGQSYELIVPFAGEVAEAVTAFHATHERRFGYNSPQERVQVVNVRLKARGTTTHPPARFKNERRAEHTQVTITPVAVRPVIFATNGPAPQDTPIYQRETLPAGGTFTGPAIVTQYDTTTVLPPSWLARIDAIGNIIAESTEKE